MFGVTGNLRAALFLSTILVSAMWASEVTDTARAIDPRCHAFIYAS